MHYQNCQNMENTLTCPNMPMSMYSPQYNCMEQYNEDLEAMYPDTYRIIYPMVCAACDMVQRPVTREIVVKITNDIDNRLGMDGRLDFQFGEESRIRNRFLNDLINILLIRELIDRRPGRPNRPPFPIRPWGM